MTPPWTTSSPARRPASNFKRATSFRSSTSRIPTGGRAEWRITLQTLPAWSPPQSSRNGKHLLLFCLRRCDAPQQQARRFWVLRYSVSTQNLSGHHRRAASKSKAREGSQSCSPFGKKKKCKDKYLAKHSSSECPTDRCDCTSTPFCVLPQRKMPILQFLTSWMWFLTRRLFGSPRSNGKLWCSSVSIARSPSLSVCIHSSPKIPASRCTWCRKEAHQKCFIDQIPWEVLLPRTTWVDAPAYSRMALLSSSRSLVSPAPSQTPPDPSGRTMPTERSTSSSPTRPWPSASLRMSCWSTAVSRDTCSAPKPKPSKRSTSRTKSRCWMWSRRSVC